MMSLLDNISLFERILLVALLVAFLYQVYFYLRYMLVKKKWMRKSVAVEEEPFTPGVSVIVAAKNEALNLKPYLYKLLEQDYPEFEVIVVNDGSEDETEQILEEYMARYNNLKMSFVPIGARVISTKKLALTLGVKAAKYDYLLFTDADCCPASKYWIKEMMQGYKNGKAEIVLGYGAYFSGRSALNRLIQYETLFTGLQYLGMAVAGHPYMGVGRNLSYKKQLFVQHNGFSDIASEKAGDDDLFVNRLATEKNTAVVTNSITWSVPKKTWGEWYQQRKRHLSVSSLYRFGSRLRLGVEPLSRLILYTLIIVLFIAGSPLVKVISLSVYLFRLAMQMSVMNISAKRIGSPLVGIEIVCWDIVYPLMTLWILSLSPKNNHW